MAIVFELVINYGHDHAAVEDACRLVAAHPPLPAGPHRVGLHRPLTNTVRDAAGHPYIEMSVVPAQVGVNVGLDGRRPRLALTAAELSELGGGLYSLLATLTGYRAARVGWDPEAFVDPVELRQEWAEELAEAHCRVSSSPRTSTWTSRRMPSCRSPTASHGFPTKVSGRPRSPRTARDDGVVHSGRLVNTLPASGRRGGRRGRRRSRS